MVTDRLIWEDGVDERGNRASNIQLVQRMDILQGESRDGGLNLFNKLPLTYSW